MVSICPVLSDIGVNTGNTASVNQHSSSLGQAGDYSCSTVALPSAPPSGRDLLKKKCRGLACQAEAQRCDEILPCKAVLRYVEAVDMARKKSSYS